MKHEANPIVKFERNEVAKSPLKEDRNFLREDRTTGNNGASYVHRSPNPLHICFLDKPWQLRFWLTKYELENVTQGDDAFYTPTSGFNNDKPPNP